MFGFFNTKVVSTHSHPKVAAMSIEQEPEVKKFQHTATRRWLPTDKFKPDDLFSVSTHSHPKVAADIILQMVLLVEVSTHSHPKVAALPLSDKCQTIKCFNTQPPEGGCGP